MDAQVRPPTHRRTQRACAPRGVDLDDHALSRAGVDDREQAEARSPRSVSRMKSIAQRSLSRAAGIDGTRGTETRLRLRRRTARPSSR